MSGEDTFHADHPEVDAWRVHEGLDNTDILREKRAEPEAKMSAIIQRIAGVLGVDAEDLAEDVSSDTIRRTKYPVRQRPDRDNGGTLFEHPEGIIEGVLGDNRK